MCTAPHHYPQVPDSMAFMDLSLRARRRLHTVALQDTWWCVPYTHTHTHTQIHTHTYIHKCLCVCVCVYIHAYVHVCVCVCVYVCMYIFTHTGWFIMRTRPQVAWGGGAVRKTARTSESISEECSCTGCWKSGTKFLKSQCPSTLEL